MEYAGKIACVMDAFYILSLRILQRALWHSTMDNGHIVVAVFCYRVLEKVEIALPL